MFAIIICGGRFEPLTSIRKLLLREFIELNNVKMVITGGATGIDEQAHEFCKSMELTCEVLDADWKKYGKSAGPIRNRQMLTRLMAIEETMQYKIAVVAFPGGTGTSNMKSIANQHNVQVVELL